MTSAWYLLAHVLVALVLDGPEADQDVPGALEVPRHLLEKVDLVPNMENRVPSLD